MNLWLPIAVILLALPAAGLWVFLVDPAGRVALDWREAAAWTAVAWATLTVLFVELLSLGTGHDVTAAPSGHLTRGWLLALWALPALAGAWMLSRNRAVLIDGATRARSNWRAANRFDRFLIAASATCLLAVGLIALLAAPNTWDSMTYHLARVANWLRLGGVSTYASDAEPQIFQPPGAELIVAQWQVLTGGDRMAAIVQWTAYAISVGVASLIAARLGGGRRAQLLAAFLLATAPMAILQGSSTQNDLVVGLWLLIAGLLALTAWQDQRLAVARVFLACVAVGLAILTKGTAWLFAGPIVLLLAWAAVRRIGWARAGAVGVAGLLVIAALNAGQWSRNHQAYGTYVYTGAGTFDYGNSSHRPSTLVSNLARNSAIYFGTPIERFNTLPTDATRGALEAIGINPDDPATTFFGQRFAVGKSGPDENHGASLVLFVLTVWVLAVAFLASSSRDRRRAAWAAIVAAQILVFCLMVKWQPWHSRLHLPILMMAIPLIAVMLERVRRQPLVTAVVALTAVAAPFYLIVNVNRPLVGADSILTTDRNSQYFLPRPALAAPYNAAVADARIRGIRELGVSGSFDDWYYPFTVLTKDGGPRISETLIGNPTGKYAAGKRLPDAIVCLHCEADRQATMMRAGLRKRAEIGVSQQGAAVAEFWSRR